MEEPTQFIKRLKAFFWHFGVALITFSLAWLTENITSLEIPFLIKGIISLALGEVTKWWNSKQFALGKSFFGRRLRK